MSHPVCRVLPTNQFHGEVEGAVDEEVGQDEGEDVGGGIGKHNVAVWFWSSGLVLEKTFGCFTNYYHHNFDTPS